MFKSNQIRAISFGVVTNITAGLALLTSPSFAGNISQSQMIKDITYLASDELKGRESFSPEIDIAANYISQRFSNMGLKTFNGLPTFKQTFNITRIKPLNVSASINGKSIENNNVAIASTMKTVTWNNPNQVKTHLLGKKDDFRKILRKINNEGGQNLILVNKAHHDIFNRYQQFFNKGLTKLSIDHQGAIVLVLTNATSVEQVNIQAQTSISTQSLSNVIATLPGKSKSDEVVMFSAHYDHLGTSPNGKEIYNGADDDASGTTAVINLAEHFVKQNNNERTLMFSAFTAEEIGGYGSRYLSQQLNPDNIVTMINIEMIGKPSKFGAGTLWMTGMERSNLGLLLNKSLASHNRQVYKDPYPEQGLFYRSDNATLARLGVPAHSFSSTQLDKDQHYHQTTDDINSLDLNSMHNVIELLSIASEDLVNGKITPTRVDVSKVEGHGKIY